MVLTDTDIAAISHVVTNVMKEMGQTQQAPRPASKVQKIDEKHYRKIKIFDGAN